MTNSRTIIASMPLVALAAACTTVGVLAWTVFRPDAVLDRSVEAALAQIVPNQKVSEPAPRQALVDSPYFRLSRLDDDLPLGISKQVHIGDRIEISGRDGESVLEVVDIRDISASLTTIDNSTGPRFLLVSAREVSSDSQRLVRFIIEAEPPPPVAIGEKQRSL